MGLLVQLQAFSLHWMQQNHKFDTLAALPQMNT
jgi:hypothetical protein